MTVGKFTTLSLAETAIKELLEMFQGAVQEPALEVPDKRRQRSKSGLLMK